MIFNILLLYSASLFGQVHDCTWGWQDPTYAQLQAKLISGVFQNCLQGPGADLLPNANLSDCCKCCYDVDRDDDVDLADFAKFTNCMTDIYENECSDEMCPANEMQINTMGVMTHVLIIELPGFISSLNGPNVLTTCASIEEFVEVYGFRPYDLDGDDDVDLQDFAVFQNGFNGTHYPIDVTAILEPG